MSQRMKAAGKTSEKHRTLLPLVQVVTEYVGKILQRAGIKPACGTSNER